MTRRVGTTRQAALHFGFVHDNGHANVPAFLSWARESKIAAAHGTTHHLWWDFKAIENHFDKVIGIKSDPTNWKKIISNRLAKDGSDQGEIPAH